MTYLDEQQLILAVESNKGIEQWLSRDILNEYIILKWVRIEKERNGEYIVGYIECFDEGNENFIDIYEFSVLDPDYPFGVIDSFTSLDEALLFSFEKYKASNEKFVISGMIQEEYANSLKN